MLPYHSGDNTLLMIEPHSFQENCCSQEIFDQNYSLLVIKSVQNTIPPSFQKYIEFVFRQEKKMSREKKAINIQYLTAVLLCM